MRIFGTHFWQSSIQKQNKIVKIQSWQSFEPPTVLEFDWAHRYHFNTNEQKQNCNYFDMKYVEPTFVQGKARHNKPTTRVMKSNKRSNNTSIDAG